MSGNLRSQCSKKSKTEIYWFEIGKVLRATQLYIINKIFIYLTNSKYKFAGLPGCSSALPL